MSSQPKADLSLDIDPDLFLDDLVASVQQPQENDDDLSKRQRACTLVNKMVMTFVLKHKIRSDKSAPKVSSFLYSKIRTLPQFSWLKDVQSEKNNMTVDHHKQLQAYLEVILVSDKIEYFKTIVTSLENTEQEILGTPNPTKGRKRKSNAGDDNKTKEKSKIKRKESPEMSSSQVFVSDDDDVIYLQKSNKAISSKAKVVNLNEDSLFSSLNCVTEMETTMKEVKELTIKYGTVSEEDELRLFLLANKLKMNIVIEKDKIDRAKKILEEAIPLVAKYERYYHNQIIRASEAKQTDNNSE